jgi:hypothetical protein
VRVLFCLFADDTGLFSPKNSFLELIERTREEAADTSPRHSVSAVRKRKQH